MATIRSFFDLANAQVELFKNDNLTWMGIMATGWQIQEIMIIAYRSLVRRGLLIHYNQIPADVWQMVDEIAKGQEDAKIRERIAISLISLEYLLT